MRRAKLGRLLVSVGHEWEAPSFREGRDGLVLALPWGIWGFTKGGGHGANPFVEVYLGGQGAEFYYDRDGSFEEDE